MSFYKKLYKENKIPLMFGFLLSLLSAVLSVMLINTINEAISSPASLTGYQVASLFLMCLGLFFFVVNSQIIFSQIGNKVVCELRIEISRRLLNTDLERVHQIGKAKIVAAFANDISRISGAFMSLPFVIVGVFITLGGFIYLAWLSLPFFSVFLVFLVLTVMFTRKMMSKMRSFIKLSRDADDRVYKSFASVIEGQSELKLNYYRHLTFDQQDLIPPIEDQKVYANKAARFNALIEGSVDAAGLTLISSLIAIYFIFTIGTTQQLMAFAVVVLFLRSPLSNVVNSINSLIMGDVAIKKISSLSLSQSVSLPEIREVELDQWQSLTITDVEYEYPASGGESGFTLGPINFHIKKGELLFIIGSNGSGKSTFARLVTRLYAPSSGTVSLDGAVIDETNIDCYRQHFAVVLSDFFLFERLLDGNGKTPSLDKLSHYIRLFKLDKKIKVTDGVLNTIELSQGQKKRLALLSAYLEDKPILILDEWAADQDPAFRKAFYRELLPDLRRRGKTIIAITHDDHYFDVADRLLKIDGGRLMPYSHGAHLEGEQAMPISNEYGEPIDSIGIE